MPTLTITKHNYINGIRNYTILIVFALLVAGYYGFTQYQKYSVAQTALAQEGETLQKTQQETNNLSAKYLEIKKVFDQKFALVLDALQYVLPPTDTYQNLARLFDQFAQDNNLPNNPFFVSDLKFGVPFPDSQKEFSILPITMTISTTKENFLKFLKFIESSGMLENKTRLMDVRSISMNFTPGGTANGNAPAPASTILNVSLALNAYFEKAPVASKK